MAATLIRNGRIVTAVDDYTADILMNDGRFHTIAWTRPSAPMLPCMMPRDSWCSRADVHTHLD